MSLLLQHIYLYLNTATKATSPEVIQSISAFWLHIGCSLEGCSFFQKLTSNLVKVNESIVVEALWSL